MANNISWDWDNGYCTDLLGHTKSVRCLNLSGSRLISGSNDCTVKVWPLNSRPQESAALFSLEGHTGGVSSLASFGTHTVSGSYDSTLRLWDISKGNCDKVFVGHSGAVLAVQIKENVIVSASADKTLRVWSAAADQKIGDTLEGHEELVSCIELDNNRVISGSFDSTAKIWDMEKGYCVSTLHGHTGPIRCLQVQGNLLVTGAFDRTVKIWDQNTNNCVNSMDVRSLVWCTRVHGEYIACGTQGGDVFIWDLRTYKPVLEMHMYDECIKDVTFVTGQCDKCNESSTKPIHLATASSSGKVKVFGAHHEIPCVATLNRHNDVVYCVVASDGTIASAGNDTKVCVWGFNRPQIMAG